LLWWAIIALVVSFIAGGMGFTGVAAGAATISRVLFWDIPALCHCAFRTRRSWNRRGGITSVAEGPRSHRGLFSRAGLPCRRAVLRPTAENPFRILGPIPG
jgi:uncharacterized membrane protein YtjA (UPF0391 family)